MAGVPPYGPAIQDALASGDADKMRQVAADAESYLQEYGEIGDGLKRLRAEIERLGGGGITPQPLYGPAIRYAIQSGSADKMQEVAKQAEDWLSHADEVRAALNELRGSGGGS
jgi:hypothetical protein